MHFHWATFALQTANFAVLVWLLHRFLYRPVLRLVDARRAAIEEQYAKARSAEADAAVQRAAVTAERAGIAAERSAALKEAASQADAAAAARQAQAERDAAALLDTARKAIAGERAAALAEVRRAALDLGAGIATRLLAEVPAKLRAEAWIERIEQYLAALPGQKRQGLSRELADGAALTIVTAAALAPATAEEWRVRLRRTLDDGRGDRLVIVFAVEPALVAGAELHFPDAVLRFSWQSALAGLRAEIEGDGHAG